MGKSLFLASTLLSKHMLPTQVREENRETSGWRVKDMHSPSRSLGSTWEGALEPGLCLESESGFDSPVGGERLVLHLVLRFHTNIVYLDL